MAICLMGGRAVTSAWSAMVLALWPEKVEWTIRMLAHSSLHGVINLKARMVLTWGVRAAGPNMPEEKKEW